MQAKQATTEFVFGGTFDPVHNGHLAIIQTLSKLDQGAMIRLLPCATPVLKSAAMTHFTQRQAMLQLATELIPNIIIDGRENRRAGKSYTVDSLVSLTQELPDRQLILVIGADNAISLRRWWHWQKLASLCHLLVLNRSNIDDETVRLELNHANFSICGNYSEMTSYPVGQAFLHKMPEMPQSSSEIRQTLRQNPINHCQLDSMLPQSVIKYIVKNHLYQSQST